MTVFSSGPSITDLAKKAGVSPMTVSRVLRNAPHVSAEMRIRVFSAAEALNYRPDPQMARLMSLLRTRKNQRSQATLAILRDVDPADDLSDPVYRFMDTGMIQEMAAGHGFIAEDFLLKPGGMSPSRLRDVLLARGVEGVLASPQSSHGLLSDFDFGPFASALFGFALTQPKLHRVTANMTEGLMETMEELNARGYRRIGVAVTDWIDIRSEHTYSGAVLHYNQVKAGVRNRVPLLFLPRQGLAKSGNLFCGWVKKHRPDVVISFDRYVPEWIMKNLGMRIPDDIGLVIHDWTEELDGLAGICHRRKELALAAVDLVANQLMRNQKGIPDAPWHILVPPRFMDGASIRGERVSAGRP